MLVPHLVILVTACGMALLAKRAKVPYTVVLVIAGLIVSTFGPSAVFEGIKLDPPLLLQVFLPILLFEAAFHVNLKQFLKNWRPIMYLAIPGVMVGMLLSTGLFLLASELVWAWVGQ